MNILTALLITLPLLGTSQYEVPRYPTQATSVMYPTVIPQPAQITSRGKERFTQHDIKLMEVTAYTLDPRCTGKTPDDPAFGITASGKKICKDIFEKDGIIAAPRAFPFGTKMYISGWGYGTVWDRGGAIRYDKRKGMYILDIFISNRAKALEWGRRQVLVKIIRK